VPGFLADENIEWALLRGLRRRLPRLDLLRVHEVGLAATDDERILDWAAQSGRIVITYDASTMIGHAYDRVARGQLMPGLVVLSRRLSIGRAIEELEVQIEGNREDEWNSRVLHLPL
jgi:hypothetical protein